MNIGNHSERRYNACRRLERRVAGVVLRSFRLFGRGCGAGGFACRREERLRGVGRVAVRWRFGNTAE